MVDMTPTHQDVDLSHLDELLKDFPRDGHELLPLLQKTQAVYGYLPRKALERIADHLRIPLARVYGVVTFYAQFYLTPRGRHCIRVCQGTACHVKGGADVLRALKRHLQIEADETTPDMRFTLETVACLGACFSAPTMLIDSDYYGHVSAGRLPAILEQYP